MTALIEAEEPLAHAHQPLPRLVASTDRGNMQTLIHLLAQIAARQATVVPARRAA